eukprot:5543725-Pleurochrysis_carterae.AAC.1
MGRAMPGGKIIEASGRRGLFLLLELMAVVVVNILLFVFDPTNGLKHLKLDEYPLEPVFATQPVRTADTYPSYATCALARRAILRRLSNEVNILKHWQPFEVKQNIRVSYAS